MFNWWFPGVRQVLSRIRDIEYVFFGIAGRLSFVFIWHGGSSFVYIINIVWEDFKKMYYNFHSRESFLQVKMRYKRGKHETI